MDVKPYNKNDAELAATLSATTDWDDTDLQIYLR